MNKFFVADNVYEDRMAICKECPHYFKLTGQCKKCLCFMKIKTRLATMACPIKKWNKTRDVEPLKVIPEDILNEVFEVYPYIKSGKAKNKEAKAKMIELYNVIYGTNYGTGTNCSTCLSTCLNGIREVYNKHKKPDNKFYEI